MSNGYTRRDLLKAAGYAGLGLPTAGMLGCSEGGTGAGTPASQLRSVSVAARSYASGISDYKALVCIYLIGGNDAYNMLVPSTPELYGLYAKARPQLALPQDKLLPLNGTAADGGTYSAHPGMSELAALYNAGQAALLSNVGNLLSPTSRADYDAGRVPPSLFSHLDQANQWQSTPGESSILTGWAGRAADVLAGVNGSSELPLNLSIAGADTLQRGIGDSAFVMSPDGVTALDNLPVGTASLRATFNRLLAMSRSNPLAQVHDATLARGIRLNSLIGSLLRKQPRLATRFPGTTLGAQLRLVAQLIGLREALGMKRQIFYVAMGNNPDSFGAFDTHFHQLLAQPRLFKQLSEGIKAFYDATVELGVAGNVTSFTASDFGRSLVENENNGTDHGWGGHHWIVGGAVRGSRIYGTPPSLEVDGADDTDNGRFIPSTSVEEYGATLIRWLDVADSDLDSVFPNLYRFGSRDMGFMT
ncbi:MAG TPA: DUF1501 domain-containing protein [Nevskiaceae bacterium]|nr:DUF1501 domain-containing protein [Nevskiaceae bacterium]